MRLFVMKINENSNLNKSVEKNGELKRLLVDYTGNKLNPKDENVTIDMLIEVVSKDFPELILVLAEENYIRGYQQALDDVSKILPEQKRKREKEFLTE